ncbi:hypothetical protein R4K92_14795 [Brachyspira intermedia]|uniref:hypothetical protein n=1 Tax=Brachyspira intermedia TaxID=84377 RepID=UPI0030062536
MINNKKIENVYEGYVFYIDLLGTSYLSSQIDGNKIISEKIRKFHNIINSINSKSLLQHSLSDSVFLYSKSDSIDCFFIVSNIFRKLIENGILCRAGCSYGKYSILRTEINENNLIGDTVSKAVGLEKVGKGHRIFIDKIVSANIKNKLSNNISMLKGCNLVTEYTNINYETFYTFNWVFICDKYCLLEKNVYIFENNIFSMSNDIVDKINQSNTTIKSYLTEFHFEKNIFRDYLEKEDNNQEDSKKYKSNPQIDITLSYMQVEEEKGKDLSNVIKTKNNAEGVPENDILQ